jgi:antitoxin YefM
MHTIYQSNANELDESLVESIKTLYKDKEIEITVAEIDETEYLLRNPENRAQLLRAIERVEAGMGIITPDQEQFQ